MVNNLRKVQFEYLEFLFKGMFFVKSKYYPNSTFFKKDDKVILELEKSGTLWVLYSVWTNISDMFSYDYGNTQQLIKEWVESQLKQEVVEPKKLTLYAAQYMGKKLKSEEITPLDAGSNYLPFMEKQLKQEEITPFMEEELAWVKVEEKLKQEEITPRSAIAPPFRWRKLDSVKYVEIKPNVPLSTYHLKVVEEKLKSEEIIPRQVVSASFDWIQEQINLGEVTPTSFFVIK